MPIIQSIVSLVTNRRLRQIDYFKQNPQLVQEKTLHNLLKQAQDTVFGKQFDFKSIHSVEQFQNQVPIHSYEALTPYIKQLREGKQNILWPTPIKWFAKSSGTTADKSKFIPVSKEALEECHFRGGKDIITLYSHNFPANNMIKGKGLVIGGSQQINSYKNELYYGDLSAVLIENLPFWANFMRVPGKSIALLDEWENKIEKMSYAVIDENVTSISGVPSWTLVLIKRILEITGKSNLLDVWPNLELFIHGGVSFVPYRDQFQSLIQSDSMNYFETFNASEGMFALQDDPKTDDMLLMLDYGVFYEFIPMDEFGKENPKVIPLADVELDKNYALILTTNGGLWRYVIGDTVKFTNTSPYKIKITGRTKFFINAFGEELIVDNAQKALHLACNQTGASIKEYTAAPVYMTKNSKGAHQWLIEFADKPKDMKLFIDLLDKGLKESNSDYEAKRHKNISLDFPQIIEAKPNLFYRWLKTRGRLGGQNKVPRLANHREFMDSLLNMNN